MKNRSMVKVSSTSELQKNSSGAIAIRILGATMDHEAKRLLKILRENKADDSISFCALSGLFFVIANNKEDLNELLGLDYYDDPAPEIDLLIEHFTEILTKNNYHDYSVAVSPELKIKKEDFWIEVWVGMFTKVLDLAFASDKDKIFIRINLANKMLFIASQYDLFDKFDKDLFFKRNIKRIACDLIDNMYINAFSNSINKIWDAGRASWEYFIRKLILFNQIIPEATRKDIGKRWEAWFLLEDYYKREQKTVKRKELLKELETSLKAM